jgi:hypothetical protein
MIDMKLFQKELENLINIHSVDNEYNTPDYILAEYLINCLTTYSIIHSRMNWHERK